MQPKSMLRVFSVIVLSLVFQLIEVGAHGQTAEPDALCSGLESGGLLGKKRLLSFSDVKFTANLVRWRMDERKFARLENLRTGQALTATPAGTNEAIRRMRVLVLMKRPENVSPQFTKQSLASAQALILGMRWGYALLAAKDADDCRVRIAKNPNLRSAISKLNSRRQELHPLLEALANLRTYTELDRFRASPEGRGVQVVEGASRFDVWKSLHDSSVQDLVIVGHTDSSRYLLDSTGDRLPRSIFLASTHLQSISLLTCFSKEALELYKLRDWVSSASSKERVVLYTTVRPLQGINLGLSPSAIAVLLKDGHRVLRNVRPEVADARLHSSRTVLPSTFAVSGLRAVDVSEVYLNGRLVYLEEPQRFSNSKSDSRWDGDGSVLTLKWLTEEIPDRMHTTTIGGPTPDLILGVFGGVSVRFHKEAEGITDGGLIRTVFRKESL